ncbi:hypothetical protein [Paenibacillus pinistramenti]|uniref:hypothetical protein n=1 Tax=Paenibacillus pinistramenti TaxID=1768003 RepID=UPI001109D076|nr:hypothetical protein [Paenibacillus pinistramenti]
MEWYIRYKEDVRWAFDQAKDQILGWEEPFRRQALHYLEGFDITRREVPTNYISFLLPFWMEEASGQSRCLSRQLSTANLFGMMSYHLLDEAMDKPGTPINEVQSNQAKLHHTLALAAMLHTEFTQIYSRIFPAASPFWGYFRTYQSEWAAAVTGELDRDWLHEDPLKMGHKASLVKLAAAGMLLLGGLADEITAAGLALDHTLMLLQMLDDWEDWNLDIEELSYNSLAAMAHKELALPAEHKITYIEMREALYTRGVLSRYADKAAEGHDAVAKSAALVPELYEFYQFLLDNLQAGAAQIEREQLLLLGGGLQYWLTKQL